MLVSAAVIGVWRHAGRRRAVSPAARASRVVAAGPVLFTAVWVVSSLRQTGHLATGVQLSGLAAGDARDPQLMTAAFVMLGS